MLRTCLVFVEGSLPWHKSGCGGREDGAGGGSAGSQQAEQEQRYKGKSELLSVAAKDCADAEAQAEIGVRKLNAPSIR